MEPEDAGTGPDLLRQIQANGPRHFSTTSVVRFFAYAHLNRDLAAISRPFADLAVATVLRLQDGPELTVALRKLLESKDAAVRQALVDLGMA